MFCFSSYPPGEARRFLLLLSYCFYPSFQLLFPVLDGDIFPDQNAPSSLQSALVHISFVEVTAKNGASFCNSHLVPRNREGRRVKKSEEPRMSVLIDM